MNEQEMQMKLASQQEKVEALRQEVAEMNKEREFWQQVHIQFIGDALNGLTSNPSFENHTLEDVIAECITLADALVAELKKGGDDDNNNQ